jgi:hypothetical protein
MIEFNKQTCKQVFTFISSDYIFLSNSLKLKAIKKYFRFMCLGYFANLHINVFQSLKSQNHFKDSVINVFVILKKIENL